MAPDASHIIDLYAVGHRYASFARSLERAT